MRILFIGDVVGRPGRTCVARWVPELRSEFEIDLVVANGENAAGGLGATPDTLKELFAAGVQAITLGNHTWKKKDLAPALDSFSQVVRPANYPAGVPGKGSTVVEVGEGRRVGIINLLGRIYMEPFGCPFESARREIERMRGQAAVIVVDMHAEATSEKIAMGWFLDGRCAAVVGTHTHVQTADERILPNGTAYITDVGMTGPRDSVIGMEREHVLHRFLTGMPREFKVAKGPTILSAVLIDADETTGKAREISRVIKTSE
ncbi:MAG: TIGR00282 family metallophosphoesterase [Candidatus Hydrogenedentes bacterium]|nr:TIGR00282 family metallophosphoesterase [Candidatus Hydrogenedentota bacterium]